MKHCIRDPTVELVHNTPCSHHLRTQVSFAIRNYTVHAYTTVGVYAPQEPKQDSVAHADTSESAVIQIHRWVPVDNVRDHAVLPHVLNRSDHVLPRYPN